MAEAGALTNKMDTNKNEDVNGAYQNEDVLWHQHSNKLLIKLMEYFKPGVPVVDLGCGHNWYSNTLKFLGYDSTGVDAVRLNGIDHCLDVTNPNEFIDSRLFLPEPYNVISLEVGEHIPANKAEGYFKTLTSFQGDICMSWAVKGQPGIGHINCQNNDWVINEMYLRGYAIDHLKTAELRHAVRDCHCSWFKNTLMYFIPRVK